jgi:hypothetical protein
MSKVKNTKEEEKKPDELAHEKNPADGELTEEELKTMAGGAALEFTWNKKGKTC